MVNWQQVAKSLMRTGLSYTTIADELAVRGVAAHDGNIANIARGRTGQCFFELGDGLLRLLRDRDPDAYERLYVQTRPDYKRRGNGAAQVRSHDVQSYGGTE